MDYSTRRSILHAGATIRIGLVTGCSELRKRPTASHPRVTELFATNLDDEPHTFHVLFEVDGTTVYRDSRSVEAPTDEVKTGVFTGYPTTPKPYEMYAWRDHQTRDAAQAFDFAEYGTKCVGLDVQIGSDGADESESHLAIYHTTNCRGGTRIRG